MHNIGGYVVDSVAEIMGADNFCVDSETHSIERIPNAGKKSRLMGELLIWTAYCHDKIQGIL